MDKQTNKVSCIASATRHTAPIGSIAIFQTSFKFFVSVSQDLCLKLWNLQNDIEFKGKHNVCYELLFLILDIIYLIIIGSLNVIHTTLAHQKDINSVTISPNDKLIATGSQDKTAKV